MSIDKITKTPAFGEGETKGEEWNNFMQKVGEVSSLVRDLASGDREKADAAKMLADKYLDGKVILDENIEMKVKSDRTVINKNAFKKMNGDESTQDKDGWMAEMSKDAERRYQDKLIRREKADTFNTMAIKAFRRGDYEKALSCYNKAIDQIKDNPRLYCDRALTYIKLEKYEKVFPDCGLALRLHEKSFKARLYTAKAYKELDESDKLEQCLKDLDEVFPQHKDLVEYFLGKEETCEGEGDEKVNMKF